MRWVNLLKYVCDRTFPGICFTNICFSTVSDNSSCGGRHHRAWVMVRDNLVHASSIWFYPISQITSPSAHLFKQLFWWFCYKERFLACGHLQPACIVCCLLFNVLVVTNTNESASLKHCWSSLTWVYQNIGTCAGFHTWAKRQMVTKVGFTLNTEHWCWAGRLKACRMDSCLWIKMAPVCRYQNGICW